MTCEHEKTLITTDDGEREVCPICGDIQVETLDDGDGE